MLGGYELRRLLGSGVLGQVYLGYDARLGRQVAVKVLDPELARHAETVQRFRAVASAAAAISHPGVISVHDIGEDAGWHYFVMTHVEGVPLSQRLAAQQRWSVGEALTIVDQVLAGLQAAHSQGVIHRDLKPDNILLESSSQRVILTDFGLIKTLGVVRGRTATGVIAGAVEYMAPEQAGGDVDHRCDLYAVGVLLYRMFAGRLPFEADSPSEIIFRHVYEHPDSLPDLVPEVPLPLWSVIARLLAKSPNQRYADARTVQIDLQAVREQRALPSGTDHVPVEDYWNASGQHPEDTPEGLIVTAPRFSPDAGLPATSTLRPWWSCLQKFWRNWLSPGDPRRISGMESTQSLIDVAVEEYRRRQRLLRDLIREGGSILLALQSQQQRSCTDLAGLIESQAGQLSDMRLKLVEVDASLARLQAQRDVLAARLKTASARSKVDGRSLKSTNVARVTIVTAGAFLLALGTICRLWWSYELMRNEFFTASPSSGFATSQIAPLAGPDPFSTEFLSDPTLRIPLSSADTVLLGFAKDGSSLNVVTGTGIVESRSPADGQLLRLLEWSPGESARIITDPHGRFVARTSAQSGNGTGQTIDACRVLEPESRIATYAIADDEVPLFLSGDRPAVVTWNPSRREIQIRTPDDQENSPRIWQLPPTAATPAAISHDGRYLAMASTTDEIYLSDANSSSGTVTHLFPAATSVMLEFSPRQPWLAVVPASRDRVVLWDLETRQPDAELVGNDGEIHQIQFDPGGRKLAVITRRQICIWDLDLRYVRMVLPVQDAQVAAFHPDSTALAVVDRQGELSVWPVTFIRGVTNLPVWSQQLNDTRRAALNQHHPAPVTYNPRRSVTADGRLAVVVVSSDSIGIEDARNNRQLFQFPVSSYTLAAAASPDGRWAATAGRDDDPLRADVRIWNLRSAREICFCSGLQERVSLVAFTPDSQWLVGVSVSHLYVWDVATGELQRRFESRLAIPKGVQVSPDNSHVVVWRDESAPAKAIVSSFLTGETLWEFDHCAPGWAFAPPEVFSEQTAGFWQTVSFAVSAGSHP